jgi:hypothetical protein
MTVLDRLFRRIVRNIPTCTLWKVRAYQEPRLVGGKIWPDGKQKFDFIRGASYYQLGPFAISQQMQLEYPKGGWTWRRLLEIGFCESGNLPVNVSWCLRRLLTGNLFAP